MEIPRYPVDYIGITGKFGQQTSRYHYGLDLGWHSFRGRPILSCLSGEVVQSGYWSDAGNMIVVKSEHNGNTIITRYLHLKDKPSVGSILEQGQQLGLMGNSGSSTGEHLHFEYWICPLGYKYNISGKTKYAVDPVKYVYKFPNQEVSKGSVVLFMEDSLEFKYSELTKENLELENRIEIMEKDLDDYENKFIDLEEEILELRLQVNFTSILKLGKYEIIKRY